MPHRTAPLGTNIGSDMEPLIQSTLFLDDRYDVNNDKTKLPISRIQFYLAPCDGMLLKAFIMVSTITITYVPSFNTLVTRFKQSVMRAVLDSLKEGRVVRYSYFRLLKDRQQDYS